MSVITNTMKYKIPILYEFIFSLKQNDKRRRIAGFITTVTYFNKDMSVTC